jgi:hypothetical protein
LETGHWPMFSAPAELAEMLSGLAADPEADASEGDELDEHLGSGER